MEKMLTKFAGPGRRRAVLCAAAALAAFAALGGSATWSALAGRANSEDNRIAGGTVSIADNDGGSTPMLGLSSASPGANDTSCIEVTYGGSLPSSVRLHGTTTGTGLDAHLALKVTRGTFSGPAPGFGSCTGFAPDGTDYTGAGSGVVYSGTLQDFPDSHSAGIVDPRPAAPESWTSGEAHVYRFEVALEDDAAAEGKNAAQSFSWEARNE